MMEALKLCTALADGIAQQLQADGRPWRVEAVPEPGDGEGREADQVQAGLVFEGAIAGAGSLRCEAAGASGIAGEVDAATWLRVLVEGCCEPVSAALQAVYGSLEMKVAREQSPVEGMGPMEKMEPIGWLVVTGEQGEMLRLTLCADEALRQGLLRFERVAAAAASSGIKTENLSLVMDVELNVSLRFGERQLSLREIMELASGSVVELDREVDEPVELILDGRVVARGEAVIVDGNYGIRVTEVLQPAVA